MSETREPEPLLGSELGGVVEESLPTGISVVQVTDGVADTNDRCVLLQGERCLNAHSVDRKICAGRIAQLCAELIIVIRLDALCAADDTQCVVACYPVVGHSSGCFVVLVIEVELGSQLDR